MKKEIKVNLTLKNIIIEQIIYSDSIQNANSSWIKVKIRIQDNDLKINYFWAHSYNRDTINKIFEFHKEATRDKRLIILDIFLNIWPTKNNRNTPEYDNTYKWYLSDVIKSENQEEK
ncbi:hypothetical protein EELLY_v1c03600 [Entomoplasma ellychniae]|uniref:Uncharacterized protein n=1 Tax=Entomoplasma ellychniae TaxID=2114 RepID=A0A8E2QY13_9MOLU|nr:hypothetical protein [Entomoplasma ellychniae]PPE04359.1 hypothetical protein EELLY_v1c00330 [Entomoplasma ellychniae]PPE04609.1 hypothetical protein EELLY_v1c02890 [Entomoplasma ellychniae]PPE04680.1 hypothetical protein EELLY_v1c03600 [Entomoplasma ellychniae]